MIKRIAVVVMVIYCNLFGAVFASAYEVNINMNADTLKDLKESGYFLYGFKAIESSNPNGKPVLWLKTSEYMENTTICWEENYGAYVSTVDPTANIAGRVDRPIRLGQMMHVDGNGICTVKSDGFPGSMSIYNEGMRQFVCGISENIGNKKFKPICCFKLHGKNEVSIKPLPRVLLVFSPENIAENTVVEQLSGPGILIDLDDANVREVSYFTNKGWIWNDEVWAEEIAAGSEISPFLIIQLQKGKCQQRPEVALRKKIAKKITVRQQRLGLQIII